MNGFFSYARLEQGTDLTACPSYFMTDLARTLELEYTIASSFSCIERLSFVR